jgi:broad-specificity NMP kinase
MLGMPGSGKSTAVAGLRSALANSMTLEEAVRDTVRRRGDDRMTRLAAHVSRSPDSRLWKAAYGRSSDRFSALTRFLDGHRELLEAVLAAQRERASRDRGQDRMLGWVLNLMARYQLATEVDRKGWLIVDEGFLQRGAALVGHGYEEADRRLLDDYLKAVPLPDAVVMVRAPRNVVVSRLDQRGWSERIADRNGEEREAFLNGTQAAIGIVADFAGSSGMRIMEIDGTEAGPDSYFSIGATLTD